MPCCCQLSQKLRGQGRRAGVIGKHFRGLCAFRRVVIRVRVLVLIHLSQALGKQGVWGHLGSIPLYLPQLEAAARAQQNQKQDLQRHGTWRETRTEGHQDSFTPGPAKPPRLQSWTATARSMSDLGQALGVKHLHDPGHTRYMVAPQQIATIITYQYQ